MAKRSGERLELDWSPQGDIIIPRVKIHRSQKVLDVRGVQVCDETFEEGHFFPRVFQNDARVVWSTPQTVWRENHREVSGVHFGLTYHFWDVELLQETNQVRENLKQEARI